MQVTSEVPASEVPSSQPDRFCGDAWQAMVSDLEPHASQILERFCIREIIRLVSGCVRDVAIDCSTELQYRITLMHTDDAQTAHVLSFSCFS